MYCRIYADLDDGDSYDGDSYFCTHLIMIDQPVIVNYNTDHALCI